MRQSAPVHSFSNHHFECLQGKILLEREITYNLRWHDVMLQYIITGAIWKSVQLSPKGYPNMSAVLHSWLGSERFLVSFPNFWAVYFTFWQKSSVGLKCSWRPTYASMFKCKRLPCLNVVNTSCGGGGGWKLVNSGGMTLPLNVPITVINQHTEASWLFCTKRLRPECQLSLLTKFNQIWVMFFHLKIHPLVTTIAIDDIFEF